MSLSDGAQAAFTDHDNGQTSGLPLVLLHGLTQQQHYWGPVLARLAGRRVITVDQRGHGEASGSQVTPQSDFSIPRLAQDVIEIFDQAGVPEAVVVGHSWGASVALHTASTFPDRVRAAVLIDGGIFGPRGPFNLGNTMDPELLFSNKTSFGNTIDPELFE